MARYGLLIALVALLAAAAPARAATLQDTLAFQERLGDTLPLRNAPWVGTHNSFNTRAERPTLSGLDANQQISMADQLELGIRSLELDIHTFPSVFADGAPAPVVCHARNRQELDAGCSTERLLDARLAEIRAWLDRNPDAFLLLYLEDHFDGVAGADAAAAMLEAELGPKLYRPPGGGSQCVPMPLDTTRRQMKQAGAQVLAISSCAEGGAWQGLVFDDAERADNEAGVEDYEGYPACDPDERRGTAYYRAHVMRFFEDSTVLSAAAAPAAKITADVARHLIRCGADILGLDQVRPGDERLAAAAWSWAPGQPSGAGCATQRASDARWVVASCKGRMRFACVTRLGNWTVGQKERYARSRRGCSGARFGLPRTGLDGAQLREAMRTADVERVWLRYRVK